MNATRRSWTNYETHVVASKILSDEHVAEYWLNEAKRADRADPRTAQRTIAAQMKLQHEEPMPDLVDVLADLLGASISRVNWLEIATYFVVEARSLR